MSAAESNDVRLIATWSGKVHAASRDGRTLVNREVQAACSRSIFGLSLDVEWEYGFASPRQRKLRDQYVSNRPFDEKDVCRNCAGAFKTDGGAA
ncbi:hypothetical protein GS479_01465 [Rhodococcus hoagii]|nr:hypothetical protein [Prescottella equi]NKR57981.1 hypothetical protein [Prescottella equi]NKR61675.1 hypothetical protein [Prescottella equi]NKS94646.1 hypothetical protein [Prescottella equi]NKS94659.1 hypothetical protein [Prescottella equi]